MIVYFKENVPICIITVINVDDLLLTLSQAISQLRLSFKMNEHRLLILINTSYMINY